MTKFNPADLASSPATEELIREAQDQSTADFVEECKADKENGQFNLTLSLAATLALAMHGRMSELLLGRGEDGKAIKGMVDALEGRDVIMAMQIAPLALNMGLHRLMMEDTKKQLIKDPLAAIGALSHITHGAKIALDAAKMMAPDIEKALVIARDAQHSANSQSVNIPGMGTLHMRDRGPIKPNPDTKPH